jgi:hypothetical protein
MDANFAVSPPLQWLATADGSKSLSSASYTRKRRGKTGQTPMMCGGREADLRAERLDQVLWHALLGLCSDAVWSEATINDLQ